MFTPFEDFLVVKAKNAAWARVRAMEVLEGPLQPDEDPWETLEGLGLGGLVVYNSSAEEFKAIRREALRLNEELKGDKDSLHDFGGRVGKDFAFVKNIFDNPYCTLRGYRGMETPFRSFSVPKGSEVAFQEAVEFLKASMEAKEQSCRVSPTLTQEEKSRLAGGE